MIDLDRPIEKHRPEGLLLDTNLLLLYLIGRMDVRLVGRFKRTAQFSVEDQETLNVLTSQFSRLVVTPHILAEANNLVKFERRIQREFHGVYRDQIRLLDERYLTGNQIADDPLFLRLGISDTGIALLAEQGPLVLTDDLDLYVAVIERQAGAINFNHVRNWLT